jgi:hypothetical protein
VLLAHGCAIVEALSVRLWGVIDLQLVEVSLIDDCNCNPP